MSRHPHVATTHVTVASERASHAVREKDSDSPTTPANCATRVRRERSARTDSNTSATARKSPRMFGCGKLPYARSQRSTPGSTATTATLSSTLNSRAQPLKSAPIGAVDCVTACHAASAACAMTVRARTFQKSAARSVTTRSLATTAKSARTARWAAYENAITSSTAVIVLTAAAMLSAPIPSGTRLARDDVLLPATRATSHARLVKTINASAGYKRTARYWCQMSSASAM